MCFNFRKYCTVHTEHLYISQNWKRANQIFMPCNAQPGMKHLPRHIVGTFILDHSMIIFKKSVRGACDPPDTIIIINYE